MIQCTIEKHRLDLEENLKKNSIILWGGIILLMILGALLTVVLPSLTSGVREGSSAGSSNHVSAPRETKPIILEVPPLLDGRVPDSLLVEDDDGGVHIELSPWLALAGLAGIVVAGIAIVGGGFSFISRVFDRLTAGMKASESYQTSLKTLEATEKERLKAINESIPIIRKKEEDYKQPRWSVLSTGAIVMLFSFFLGTAIRHSVGLESQFSLGSRMFNTGNLLFWLIVLLTLIALFVHLRPKLLDRVNGEIGEGAEVIPWDLIFLIITGCIMIVGGIGLLLYYRPPVG